MKALFANRKVVVAVVVANLFVVASPIVTFACGGTHGSC